MKIALALTTLVVSTLVSMDMASAQTWNGTSSSDWNTASNWSNSSVPGASNTATFSSTTGLQTTVNVSSSDTIKLLYFAASSPAYTLTTTPGQTLTIDTASTNSVIAITQASAGVTDTINGSVLITNSASTTGNMLFSLTGNLTFGTLSGLTFASAGPSVASGSTGNLSILGALTISSSLVLNWNPTSGILYYNPTSQNVSSASLRSAGGAIYLGTSFTGSKIVIGSTSALAGAVYLNATGITETASVDMNASTTGKGAGVYVFGANATGTATMTQSGAITMNTVTGNSSTDQFDVAANNTLVITGKITGTNTGNGTTFSKTGAGTLILANSNTYTATTSVVAGTILANATGAITSNTINVTGASSSATATLGGSGSITSGATANTVIIGVYGILAPGSAATGNSISTLTLNMAGSTLATNAAYLSFADPTASLNFSLGSGLTSSKLALISSAAGRVSFDGNAVNFTDTTGGLLSLGTYTLITSDAANTFQGLSLAADGITITGGLTIGTGLSAYTSVGEVVSLQLDGNNIDLVIAVPEPSTFSLSVVSMMGVLGSIFLKRKS